MSKRKQLLNLRCQLYSRHRLDPDIKKLKSVLSQKSTFAETGKRHSRVDQNKVLETYVPKLFGKRNTHVESRTRIDQDETSMSFTLKSFVFPY